MKHVDLNCDLAEGAGQDEELMPLITSANIACGAHAGGPGPMRAAVAEAARHGVGIGAHPGFYDRENFGRVERAIEPAEAGRMVGRQIRELAAIAGSSLRHVKLHGALYNQAARDAELARGIVAELVRDWPGLIVFALAGSRLAAVARAAGLRVAEEVFGDRTYQRDGSLTPRSRPAALIEDEEAAVVQVLGMVRDGVVRATDGTMVPIAADTICLHGDGSRAVEFARRIRKELAGAGVAVRAFGA